MEISDTLTEWERAFNVADSIPLIALVSSPLRAGLGKIQAVAGLVIGIFGCLGYLATCGSKKWSHMASIGGENLLHGILNVLRGVGEFFLGITLIGSLGLLFVQLLNDFGPVVKYSKPPVIFGPMENYC